MVKSGMTRAALFAAVLAAAGATTGCATGLGGDVHQRGEARRTMEVRFATITSVRPVQIEGTKTPVGTVAGAAVGGIAGSTVGGGKGSTIGAVLGAVAGGCRLWQSKRARHAAPAWKSRSARTTVAISRSCRQTAAKASVPASGCAS